MLLVKPLFLFRQFKNDKLKKQKQGGDVELERVAGPYNVFVEDNRVSIMQVCLFFSRTCPMRTSEKLNKINFRTNMAVKIKLTKTTFKRLISTKARLY